MSFYTLLTASDLLVVWEDSANSRSSLFSSFSLHQPLNLPQTKFTFSHVGWTAGMEWKSCSQDTGLTRSSGTALTADSTTSTTQRCPSKCVAAPPLPSSLVTLGSPSF